MPARLVVAGMLLSALQAAAAQNPSPVVLLSCKMLVEGVPPGTAPINKDFELDLSAQTVNGVPAVVTDNEVSFYWMVGKSQTRFLISRVTGALGGSSVDLETGHRFTVVGSCQVSTARMF